MPRDQAVLVTYDHDVSIGATDTLGYWVILSTVNQGTENNLVGHLLDASSWIDDVFWFAAACCFPPTQGDANCSGNIPSVSDITTLIDHLFISGAPLCCLDEADANFSGGRDPGPKDITVSDIAAIINFLFITGDITPCGSVLNGTFCTSSFFY